MNQGFTIGVYFDSATNKSRWAVVGGSVWYFPKRYGKEAARALCRRMNAQH